MSVFQVLGESVRGERPWDVPTVSAEIAAEITGTGLAETLAMLDIASSWSAASDGPQLMGDLFSSGRMTGDSVSYDDPSNSFIHSAVQRGRGIPLTLAIIAVEIGRRRDIQLEVVGMPGHVLLKDPTLTDTYFDPFHGGKRLDAMGCRVLYERMTGLGNWRDEFLESIDAKQQVFRMLNNLKSFYRRSGHTSHLRTVMVARSLFPGVATAERDEFARLMRETN
jgi:regulator of sirC expression with transglutaminase-like and TPR domain